MWTEETDNDEGSRGVEREREKEIGREKERGREKESGRKNVLHLPINSTFNAFVQTTSLEWESKRGLQKSSATLSFYIGLSPTLCPNWCLDLSTLHHGLCGPRCLLFLSSRDNEKWNQLYFMITSFFSLSLPFLFLPFLKSSYFTFLAPFTFYITLSVVSRNRTLTQSQ